MKLVDVHCHLNHALFKDDVDKVIERAKKAGVQAILVSGVNPAGNKEVLELCKKDSILKASLGIYPIDALGLGADEAGLPVQKGKIDLEKQFAFIEQHKDEVTAIGEVGMDFKWADRSTENEQTKNFRKIIQFAKKVKKPLVIHSRKAEAECLEILEEELPDNETPVDLHCFSGKKALVKKAIQLGYYFSIPPNCIKSQHFQMIIEMAPLQQLLTETDAPWLSHDGERNEPKNVIESIKKIGEIKKISVKETEKQVWENYEKFIS
jgi:TatD DNase family protein